jgi:hypothetical protein
LCTVKFYPFYRRKSATAWATKSCGLHARSRQTLQKGYGRFHYLDNSKFCSNARGSCAEVLDHLITAADEKLISSEVLGQGRARIETALKLINGYMAYLKRSSGSVKAPITNNE